jgi:hypothetical protein
MEEQVAAACCGDEGVNRPASAGRSTSYQRCENTPSRRRDRTWLTLQIVMEISHLMTAQTQEEADSRFGKIKKTILDAAEQVQAV